MTIETAPAHDSIPQLTDQYHKGRKFYTLTSGVLLAWTLVGIELAKEPLESLKVSLKNPDVTPIILVLLVLYFAYRTSVEWYQSDARRRNLRASQLDFTVTNILGIISISVYSFQEVSAVNVGAYFARYTALAIPSAIYLFVVVMSSYYIGRLLVWSVLTPPRAQRNRWCYYRLPMLWTERTERLFRSPRILGYEISIPNSGFVGNFYFGLNFSSWLIVYPFVMVFILYAGFVNPYLIGLASPLTTSFAIVAGCLLAWFARYWKYDLIINPGVRFYLGLSNEITNY